MPSAPKSAGPANPAKASVPFEEALQKLEAIVEAMESGELSLEELLTRYEEGMKLARLCQEKLADAEVRIQQLEKTAGGELKLKPLSLESSDA
ncbi:MAG: exodeoxyribonuclease VII small subunit [Verrucomicrobia bacterium]|nr:exodeoxyribonuclease VII small subunit [Verrucomicrobiota bacterium]